MHILTRKVQLSLGLTLCAALGSACGSAPSDGFFSPSSDAGEAAGAPAIAGAGGAAATLEPSLPAGGAGVAGASVAGSSSVAGAAPVVPDPPTPMKSLVDDMEAMVSSILEADGRAGYWYTFNDGLGSAQMPAPNGPFLPDPASDGYPGSLRARHSHGAAFPSYAGFGFDLNNRAGQRLVYDASAYAGVVLWARGNVSLRVMLPTRVTAPTEQGGVCTSVCNDSFGVELPLTAQWTEQRIPFATLRQRAVSDAAFDAKTVLGVAFSVPPGQEFDVWVDEIGFF